MRAKRQRAMRMWVGVLAVAVVALAGCGRSPGTSGTTGTVAPTSTSTFPTTEPPPEPTPSPTTRTTLTGMPVYFVGESQGYYKLFREFREFRTIRMIRMIDGPISSSISAMMRLTPLDPDYFNPWRSASRVGVTWRFNSSSTPRSLRASAPEATRIPWSSRSAASGMTPGVSSVSKDVGSAHHGPTCRRRPGS